MFATIQSLFRLTSVERREKQLLWLTLILIALAGVLLLLPHDVGWGRYWFAQRTDTNQRIANAVSYWGDFPRGWMILIALLLGGGLSRKKINWRVVALAALLAGCAAGLQAHIVRYTTGRARPSTGMNGDFYGPSLQRAFHSFPSAHTTCAFAVATVLVVTMPALGVPAWLVAALVGWSRLALTAHYPTDVWLGMWFGIVNGLIFGLAARRLLKGTG
jgi:undecaprenyl-diphosphatase